MHSQTSSYHHVDSDRRINKGASKGRQLIILHAITRDGPLCQRDNEGKPYDDLSWNKDTPHPQAYKDRKPDDLFTCETLWIATSKSGDYHDNMDSNMFMQWVEQKLLPTFNKQYPGKRMVLVCDNAPYHHKREIGAMNTKTKKQIIDMMEQDGIDEVTLPLNDARSEYLEENTKDDNDNNADDDVDDDDDEDKEMIHNLGDGMQIRFYPDEQKQTSNANRPCVATVVELKASYMSWLQLYKPE
jgi:hypothetical protein